MDGISEIKQATQEARNVIAEATQEAAKVIASAASEALEVVNVKNDSNSADHDILIELRTEVRGIKADIKEVKDGTSATIASQGKRIECLEVKEIVDGEKRLKALEVARGFVTVMLSIGSALLAFLASINVYHMVMK